MGYLLSTGGMLIFISILCAIMGVVLCGFFIWHLNLIRMGTTTNELSKWKYLKWNLKYQGDEEGLKSLCNIYNRGFFKNLMEVLLPINVDRISSTSKEKPEKTEKPEK